MADGTDIENAVVNLLRRDPVLSALDPRGSEYVEDQEPRKGKKGNLRNPNLSVKCGEITEAFGGGIVGEPIYFSAPVEVTLWMEVDGDNKRQKLGDYFRRIGAFLNDPALHNQINEVDAFEHFVGEGTKNRRLGKSVDGNRFTRTYAFDFILAWKT